MDEGALHSHVPCRRNFLVVIVISLQVSDALCSPAERCTIDILCPRTDASLVYNRQWGSELGTGSYLNREGPQLFSRAPGVF
jgi:hypothetical protein